MKYRFWQLPYTNAWVELINPRQGRWSHSSISELLQYLKTITRRSRQKGDGMKLMFQRSIHYDKWWYGMENNHTFWTGVSEVMAYLTYQTQPKEKHMEANKSVIRTKKGFASRFNNFNEAYGCPELNRILTAAAKLGLSPDELAEMAGLERRVISKWEGKWRIHGPNFCPRSSSFRALWKVLEEVSSEKDKAALQEMRNAKVVVKVEPPQMVALTQADLDLQKRVEEARAIVPTPAPVPMQKVDPPIRSAAAVIKSLIVERLDSMTFIELALTLAHVIEGKK